MTYDLEDSSQTLKIYRANKTRTMLIFEQTFGLLTLRS